MDTGDKDLAFKDGPLSVLFNLIEIGWVLMRSPECPGDAR